MLSYDDFGIEEISTHVTSMKASYIMLYLDMFAYDGFGIEYVSANVAKMQLVFMV